MTPRLITLSMEGLDYERVNCVIRSSYVTDNVKLVYWPLTDGFLHLV